MAGCTLISFDVDGTLIHSVGPRANKLHKEAFSAAFKKVFDLDTHIDTVQHHGSTDPLILIKVLEYHGVPREQAVQRLPELQQAMVDHFHANKHDVGEGLELLPGVLELMQRLQLLSERGCVATCLVTGNLEPIGWGKMGALGILQNFSSPLFGGFGSDHCSGNHEEPWRDRARLVEIAAEKARAQVPGGQLAAHYHIGDTPNDILAAQAVGATAVGVLTGIFSRQELEQAAAEGPPGGSGSTCDGGGAAVDVIVRNGGGVAADAVGSNGGKVVADVFVSKGAIILEDLKDVAAFLQAIGVPHE